MTTGTDIPSLPAATAFASGDFLVMHDISAPAGQRSKKTTFTDFFANVPSPIRTAPTTGFTLGGDPDGRDGKAFFRTEFPDGQHPFQIALSTYGQGEGERLQPSYRMGVGFKDQEAAVLEDGINGGALLAFEMDFIQGGYKDEIWFGLYCRDGADSSVNVRPIFISALNDDPETFKSTVQISLTGIANVVDPTDTTDGAGGTLFFALNRNLGRLGARLKDGQSFRFHGDTSINAGTFPKGSIGIKPHSENGCSYEIGFTGGSDEIVYFQSPASSVGAEMPERLVLGINANGPFFSMRRRADGGAAFGLGKMPAATDDNASVHFASYLNLDEIAAPGDPASGQGRLYIDTNGDLVAKINHGGTTKTVIVVDWSAAP